MRKSIKDFTVIDAVNFILHFLYRFLTNAVSAVIVVFGLSIMFSKMEPSDFPFEVDAMSLALGIWSAVIVYFLYNWIIDVFECPQRDYWNGFKKIKRRLGGHANG